VARTECCHSGEKESQLRIRKINSSNTNDLSLGPSRSDKSMKSMSRQFKHKAKSRDARPPRR
jgi:hypothetical protein